MAAMHGKGGTAVFTNLTLELLSWSVEPACDMAEATDMGDTPKTYLAGFKSWTATAECNLPATGVGIAASIGTSTTLTFDTDADGGLAYAGTAICTGISPSVDKDDVAKVSLSFQGTGAMTES